MTAGTLGERPLSDAVDLENRAQGQLSVTTVTARTAALDEGIYDVWCDVDVWVEVALNDPTVTTSTGYLINAGNTVPVIVRDQRKIGAVSLTAGTLRYFRVL